jgi:hypothetical protein
MLIAVVTEEFVTVIGTRAEQVEPISRDQAIGSYIAQSV